MVGIASVSPVLAEIPTHVVHGGSAADRTVAIERLIAAYPHERMMVVFRPGIAAIDPDKRSPNDRVVVRQAPVGCACCTSQVAFRIALVRSLRADRPTRLIVDLAPGTHVGALKSLLTDRSFVGVLDVLESVDLDHSEPGLSATWRSGLI